MNLPCQLDHIVIAAKTLEQGVEWFHQTTGVDIPPGGHHPLMGTHNHLMQIGNNAFLEIIAIDPDRPAPVRPRWYALDDPLMQRSLSEPRLITWVANTENLADVQSNTTFHFGDALEVTRGNLRWQLTVPQDGSLPDGGLMPSLIQWYPPGNPCPAMSDTGCQIQSLIVHHHYPEWYLEQVSQIGCQKLVRVCKAAANAPQSLELVLQTPTRLVSLYSL